MSAAPASQPERQSGSPSPAEPEPRPQPSVPPQLLRARHTIDNIDAAIIHMLAERFRCTQEVGELKARLELPAADPAREQRQISRLQELARESGLDPVFARKFLRFIVDEVIHHHVHIAERYNSERGAAEAATDN